MHSPNATLNTFISDHNNHIDIDNMKISPRVHWQYLLFSIFALSGFSGLIYESVWTNYLKLFLGHAAYAQTLVLALFMGGMAGGAWLAGRYMSRIKNPLIAYAVIEAVIGLFGIFFHRIFLTTSSYMLDIVLPGMDSASAIELVRWIFAAILILPQTLLLGATFPLVSVGILRAFPNTPGNSISMLYFTNSIGAVFGVLTSGFYLVNNVGLPGTILTAALINFLLAIVVYSVSKQLPSQDLPPKQTQETQAPLLRPLLFVSLITGLSSFIYEISWIRMLTMVLGASTHAFELMLSAFILGLALGGLWLRKRIDKFTNPLHSLGVIQLLMGSMALLTVLIYNTSFEVMIGFSKAISNSPNGYVLFNFVSHAIAAAVMLPTTFLAGMTLPLITFLLYKQGGGESAVGKVYAFNTLGAILGVALAALLLLPMLGLKNAIIIGAALDLLLALFLFSRANTSFTKKSLSWLFASVAIGGTLLAPPFNPLLMASGVFRSGKIYTSDLVESVMHRDGKTATIDVIRTKGDGTLSIMTNGKPDASVASGDGQVSFDEPTMVMLGGLPLLAHPKAQTAAVIGMGAGMTADVMLRTPQLKSLDVIEIESAMVEGARLFGKASERVFTDPRSHIYIDDAKSYFSANRKRYDIIVSEPSDTWVSGVSSLFTNEFYSRIRHHLEKDGLLVQWLHMYETSPKIVSSIFTALGNNFTDYRVYATNSANIVILAKMDGKLPALSAAALQNPNLSAAYKRTGWQNFDDIRFFEVGDRELLEPLFIAINAPVNSDFFPFVDQNAVAARFQKTNFASLVNLRSFPMPLPGSAFDGKLKINNTHWLQNLAFAVTAQQGRKLGHYLASGAKGPIPISTEQGNQFAAALTTKPLCDDLVSQTQWARNLVGFASISLPFMSEEESQPMLKFLEGQLCDTAQENRKILHLMAAISARNMQATELAAKDILGTEKVRNRLTQGYAFHALTWAYYNQAKWQELQTAMVTYDGPQSIFSDIALAHARLKLNSKQ